MEYLVKLRMDRSIGLNKKAATIGEVNWQKLGEMMLDALPRKLICWIKHRYSAFLSIRLTE